MAQDAIVAEELTYWYGDLVAVDWGRMDLMDTKVR